MYPSYKINLDWSRLANQIVKPNQSVLVVGTSDAGKSTFCRYLIDCAYLANLNVGFVDTDVGQSQIGPPTTIGMKLFEGIQTDLESRAPFGGGSDGCRIVETNLSAESENNEFSIENKTVEIDHTADALYFVGDISPYRNLLHVLTGTRLMVEAAYNRNVDFIVIDTSGYVNNRSACSLKQQKIDLIRPTHLVCIGRTAELERIVGVYNNLSWLTVHYLIPHKETRTKGRETRKQYRTKKFKRYFRDSKLQKIPFQQIRGVRTLFFNGRIANPKELQILSQLTGIEIDYAEWGNRSLSIVTRTNLPKETTNKIKDYYSLRHLSIEKPVYFENCLVGMLNEDGYILGIGLIDAVDFQKHELNIRCKTGIASGTKVLQLGDYRLSEI